MKLIALIFALITTTSTVYSQTVGLVLSGGGANGMAHIGVLKALEEAEIPIDYITGTSMGAIVGGLYVAGYSPDQIEAMLNSPEFINEIQGEINEKYIYYFKQPSPDPTIAQFKFAKGKTLNSLLPTNLVSPIGLDYKMIETFAGANAVSGENFDSLFIPFRCVASDITNKKIKVLRHGQLNKAVRASSTYPFYYKPVLTDGELLFDGGLYNNFPVDILIQDFNPDIIIGSNVSYNYDPPTVDDLVSQLKNMLVNNTDYSLKGKPGVLIEPKIDLSAFDYTGNESRIAIGYQSTIDRMGEIELLLSRRVKKSVCDLKRKNFNDKKPPLIFEGLAIKGVNAKQAGYLKRSLIGNLDTCSNSILKTKFIKLFQDDQLKYIYPSVKYNELSGRYTLELMVEKEKDFTVKFGGNFSSKPINTGYLALKYNFLSKHAYTAEASSYFGKYYGSIQVQGRMQTGWSFPIFIEPFVAINRWDYFKSKATFFEDARPTYILFQEKLGGVLIGMPLKYKSRLLVDFKLFNQEGNYYLTDEFSPTDTADYTKFQGYTSALTFQRSTLNRKQWASKGTDLKMGVRFYDGFETTLPGSTSLAKAVNRQKQTWVSIHVDYSNYFKTLNNLTLGYHVSGLYNTKYFFSNFKASQLFTPAFQPIPESKTLFLSNFRANKYLSTGLSAVVDLGRNVDFRLEGFIFQPINTLEQTPLQLTEFGRFLGNRYLLLSTSFVYHTPIGPVSMSVNYYEKERVPVSFILNFGYILFNRSVGN